MCVDTPEEQCAYEMEEISDLRAQCLPSLSPEAKQEPSLGVRATVDRNEPGEATPQPCGPRASLVSAQAQSSVPGQEGHVPPRGENELSLPHNKFS